MDCSLCIESEAGIFLATVKFRRLIVCIDANNVSSGCTRICCAEHAWTYTCMVKMHLFIVCRATLSMLHVVPSNRFQFAARTGIIRKQFIEYLVSGYTSKVRRKEGEERGAWLNCYKYAIMQLYNQGKKGEEEEMQGEREGRGGRNAGHG